MRGVGSIGEMVDELLRWTTPVLHHSRWATRSIDVAGESIQAGDRVTYARPRTIGVRVKAKF